MRNAALGFRHPLGDDPPDTDALDLRRVAGIGRQTRRRRPRGGAGRQRRVDIFARDPSAGTRAGQGREVHAGLAGAAARRRRGLDPPGAAARSLADDGRRHGTVGDGRHLCRGLLHKRRRRFAARACRCVQFEHREFRSHGHRIAGLTAQRHEATGRRGVYFHNRLVGRQFNERGIFLDEVTRLDVPGDYLGRHRAFTEVRNLEDVAAHEASMTDFSAAMIRAGPGKYSHSKACG